MLRFVSISALWQSAQTQTRRKDASPRIARIRPKPAGLARNPLSKCANRAYRCAKSGIPADPGLDSQYIRNQMHLRIPAFQNLT
ncbi:MAG: hypothetical protein BWX48_03284 [Verrucomicrobia bacterium ADurb.Bin006]|jgi:hypothetical protein|nr:MAG: hypothetical protein BWX48_03284 [Verrucomicrobia bacterium ADurb.Bin006]